QRLHRRGRCPRQCGADAGAPCRARARGDAPAARGSCAEARMNRRGLLALIHCARKDHALTEDTYRAMMANIGGAESAAALSDADLGRVVDHLRKLGWKPKSAGKRSESPVVRKIWAM